MPVANQALSPEEPDDVFWRGFGLDGCPRLEGKTVLEIGCGEGSRCLEIGAHGADRVVGVDTLEHSILVSRGRLAKAPPAWRDRVSFFHGAAESLPAGQFDLIISENSLEHVNDVRGLLAEARRRLKPSGRLYIGFGPLYHAPGGDHGWLREVLPGRRFFPWPWGHLLFERFALWRLSHIHGRPITKTIDWPYDDLNKHTLEEFEEMFRTCGLRIVELRKNYVRSLAGQLFSALGRLPVLARYFTLNVFVIFEHPSPLITPWARARVDMLSG
jgi:SAM-dependent methyltransferase